MTSPMPRLEDREVRYSYHFTDFRTGMLRATLPLSDVSLSDVLSGASDGSAALSLSEQVRARDPFMATTPRRACMWAVREELDPLTGLVADTSVPWAGLVMGRKRSLLGRSMSLRMITWAGYLQRRRCLTRSFAQADVFTIHRTLLRDALQQLPIPGRLPGQPSRSYPPVVFGQVSADQWEQLIRDGWRGRLGDPVRTTEPLVLAAIALRDRVSAGLDYFEDLSWYGNPQVVREHNDDLMRAMPPGLRWDDVPGMTAWLNDYIAARAGVAILYHPLAPPSPAPVLFQQVTRQQWDALLAQGWRGRDDGTDNRIYPPLSLMTYVSPAVQGELYYPPSAYPTVSPHHFALDTTSGPTSGRRTDREYLATDQTPTLEALTELSDAEGYDWRLVPYLETPGDLTTFRLRSELGMPRLGRVQPPDVRWSTLEEDSRDRWGVILGGDLDEDGGDADNRKTAMGSGTGDTQLRATVDSSSTTYDEMDYGYPLYEGEADTAQDDRTQAQVTARARGALLSGLASETTLTGIQVRGDLPPTVPTYTVGDDATIKVDEGVNGERALLVGQIVGRNIKPPQSGSTEQVTIDVQGTVND